MSIYQFKTDGVSKRFTVPFPTGFISAVSGGGSVSGDHIVFNTPPVAGLVIQVTYQIPTTGSSGGGITSEQLDQLVSDTEATNLYSGVIGTINQRADSLSNKVDTTRGDILTALASSGAYTGKIDMRLAPNGQATSGWTKLGGIGVPDNFFNTVRTALLPYVPGPNGVTDGSAAGGRRVTIGDIIYVFPTNTTAARSYNVGNSQWADLASVVFSGGVYASVVGSVNGKVLATGAHAGNSQVNAVQTLDPATGSWSTRASLPTFRQGSGIADLQDGTCALFGGKDTNDATATSATNITATVRTYNEAANTFTAQTDLPVRMHQVRTVVRPDKSVILFPVQTSDGTTLVSNSRRTFRWSLAGGTVECDPVPAEVSTTVWLLNPRSDGTVVYVPTTTPSSGSRARLFNPNAAAGSQWTNLDWDYNAGTTYGAIQSGCESKATGSGFMMTASPSLSLTFVGVPQANWSQVIYQAKN